jgi:uncharacterized protein (UPF0335 family)
MGGEEVTETPQAGSNSNEQLRSIVERIENLEGEIKERRSDVSDIYAESKSNGFDVPALKAIVRARRETAEQKAKREEREVHEGVYRGALGMG